ncbi:MAG: multidrug effflux MFS transporter [Rubrivivax sp.]|jgi:DHA1 family bicyclomycin/chloramphenicol resistance-like MFS transporter|nr:multidrug effflux MFS transporter [Rubrivivax sp.]
MTSGSEGRGTAEPTWRRWWRASRPQGQRPAAWLVVPALAALLGLQPVTTDLYLPALPQLQADLNASMTSAQLTLSALLLAFGLTQLVAGPLADRHGRKRLMLLGLGGYLVATVASAVAPDIRLLVLCRICQGMGLAAVMVCARAMVRDLFEPTDGAKTMARALSGLGVVALTGPPAGAMLATAFGWRATFLACTLYAVLLLVFVWLWLPETLRQRNPDATRLKPWLQGLGHIARHPTFRAWALLMAFTYGAIYTFLAGSAFLYTQTLGSSRLAFGLAMSLATGSYIVGTLLCHRVLRRHGMQRAVRRGAIASCAAALLLVVLAGTGSASFTSVTLACMLVAFGHGHHQPCAQVAVAGPFPALAGTASALAGFTMSALAFGISAWLGRVIDGSAAPILLTQAAFAALTAWVAWTWVQRPGMAGAAPLHQTPG